MDYDIPFENDDYKRYSRHFVIKEMEGKQGMFKLKNAHVGVFGAGGLGCPLTTYLVGTGVGKLTIFDDDIIDVSNLSRQIAYTTNDIGKSKVETLVLRLRMMNPNVDSNAECIRFTQENFDYFTKKSFTVLADCTDNIETRYLINELALKLNIPLVSAGALIWSGQLTVYNYKNGPCFRCIFPIPPSPTNVTQSCDKYGIIAPVVGILGNLQALEVIKVILDFPTTMSSKFLTYNGITNNFKIVKIRNRVKNCPSCSLNECDKYSYIDKLKNSCLIKKHDNKNPDLNITVKELYNIVKEKGYSEYFLIIDCRENFEYSMLNFKNIKNIPYTKIMKEGFETIEPFLHKNIKEIIVLCHRGNTSQDVCKILREANEKNNFKNIKIKNVIGGIDRWATEIDIKLPRY